MIQILVEDIMSEHPIKVKESATIGQVAHLLLRFRINGILVVENDNDNHLIGVFTTTDLLRILDDTLKKGAKKLEEIKNVSELRVGELASRPVISLQKNAKVTKALAIMHRKNIHTIPILDGDQLVGVIGRHDILNIALSK